MIVAGEPEREGSWLDDVWGKVDKMIGDFEYDTCT